MLTGPARTTGFARDLRGEAADAGSVGCAASVRLAPLGRARPLVAVPVQGLHTADLRGLPAALGRLVRRPRRGAPDGSPRRCRTLAARRRRLRAIPGLG